MRRLLLLALALCLLSQTASAQNPTGRLTGTISSPDGIIAGATVTVINNQTERERTTVTSDDGTFNFTQLDPGIYTVNVSATGFKSFTAADVKIDVGREYSLTPTLEVGDISETVTVVAGADILNATTAELSTTVSPRQVIDLPINGRNPLALLNLIAGANATSDSINGQRSSTTNYTRDGINVQDQFIRTGGFVQDRPSVDDTGEFTVTTQNAGAEQGGGGSTQVQLVTPRGGSDFGGALFAFNRNSGFAANSFFNNSTLDPLTGRGIEQPFLNQNQFGGKLGGPLAVPRFGEGGPTLVRGKAFFFGAFEKLILRNQASRTRTVLLAPARNGAFTYTAARNDPAFGVVAGQPVTVNVLTSQGLNFSTTGRQTAFRNAGGVLAVDPLVQSRLLSNIPTIGNLAVTNGGLTQQLRFNQNANADTNTATGRLDFDLDDRNSINFVYRYIDTLIDRGDFDAGGFSTTPFANNTEATHFFTGAYRTTVGSSFVNEVRGGYTQSKPFFNQGAVATDFIIEDQVIGAFGITNPEPTQLEQGRNTRQITFRDDASFIAGDHSLRFGGQIESQKIVSLSEFGTIPTFTFSTSANPNTPGLAANLFPGGIGSTSLTRADALRYFLGGIIGAGAVQANSISSASGPIVGAPLAQDFRYENYGLYVSDQWRVTPQLTLNLGLRYDLFTPIRNPDRIFLEPVIPADANIRDAILNPNGSYDIIGTNIGKPGSFFNADKDNFAPNFSFAYAPQFKNKLLGSFFGDGRTVIRGGYRISYVNDEYLLSAFNAAGGNDGLNLTVNAEDTLADGSTTINLNRRLNTLSPGIQLRTDQVLQPPFTFAGANAANGAFFNVVFAIDPNLQVARNHEYNFGIQREIGFQTAVEVRYVGGHSNSLTRAIDLNQVDIRDNGLLDDFNNARFNLQNFGAADCTDAGCRPVGAFFDRLGPGGAFFGVGFTESFLQAGTPGDLAVNLVQLSDFFPGARDLILQNPNAGPVDLLGNFGRFRYNALQTEIRRRFTNGFSLQANYTLQKILTDVAGQDQNRFDPFIDNAQPELEYARADYDRTHTFNFNSLFELPFGRGKRFLDRGGFTEKLLGGFQLTSIINIGTGAPISILDPRGTLNRGARSGRQTAYSTLTTDEIKNLVGIFRTPNGVFYIDPSVIAPDGTATGSDVTATPASPAFPGQVFFNAQPGQTGGLVPHFINGPLYVNLDLGLSKRIRFSERASLQLRAEAFNAFNRANFRPSSGGEASSLGENSPIFNINSTTFGRITNTYAPRVLQFGARFEF